MTTGGRTLLLMWLGMFAVPGYTGESVPADVRYLIEEMYGSDQTSWPRPIYSRDLNQDGLADWVAQQAACRDRPNCQVDVFLCKAGTGTECREYCYSTSGILSELLQDPHGLKCQSTC